MTAKILIVEDDAALLTLLQYNIASGGYEVDTATTAEDGQLLLAEGQYDIVVLDWMLPEMSGIELCGRLRRMSKSPQVALESLHA